MGVCREHIKIDTSLKMNWIKGNKIMRVPSCFRFKYKLCNKTKLSNFMVFCKVFSVSDFKWEIHDGLRRGRIVKICWSGRNSWRELMTV